MESLWKWLKKHKIIADLIVFSLFIIVVGTIGQAHSNSAKRNVALKQQTSAASACSLDAQTFLGQVNQLRTTKNVPNLQYSTQLESAAAARIADMQQNKYYGHTNPVTKEQSYTFVQHLVPGATTEGEVLDGPNSATDALADFKNSPEHYADLIGSQYTFVGVKSVYTDESWAVYDNNGALQSPAGAQHGNCTVIAELASSDSTTDPARSSSQPATQTSVVPSKSYVCAEINDTGLSSYQTDYNTDSTLLQSYSGENRDAYVQSLNSGLTQDYKLVTDPIVSSGCSVTFQQTLLT